MKRMAICSHCEKLFDDSDEFAVETRYGKYCTTTCATKGAWWAKRDDMFHAIMVIVCMTSLLSLMAFCIYCLPSPAAGQQQTTEAVN